MKKLLFFLIILGSLQSCFSSKIEPISNPDEITTIYLQSIPRDTVTIAIQDNILYVFNTKNKVKYEVRHVSKGDQGISVFLAVLIVIVLIAIMPE